MVVKILLLVIFFAVMIGVGLYCRRRAADVNGFVLGGRNVGPWLTAFAFGTSYFSAVIFVGYAGQFGWRFGATRSSVRSFRGRYSDGARASSPSISDRAPCPTTSVCGINPAR